MTQKKYELLREMCNEAASYRRVAGLSEVTDEMIEKERRWLKLMINEGTEDPETGEITRDSMTSTIVGLTLWSAFSVQVYSKERKWPERPMTSIEAGEPSFFRKPHYQDWMKEDLFLIKAIVLETESVNNNIKQLIQSNDLTNLKEGERIAIEKYETLLAQNPSDISLISLANFISGLNRLRKQSL